MYASTARMHFGYKLTQILHNLAIFVEARLIPLLFCVFFSYLIPSIPADHAFALSAYRFLCYSLPAHIRQISNGRWKYERTHSKNSFKRFSALKLTKFYILDFGVHYFWLCRPKRAKQISSIISIDQFSVSNRCFVYALHMLASFKRFYECTIALPFSAVLTVSKHLIRNTQIEYHGRLWLMGNGYFYIERN